MILKIENAGLAKTLRTRSMASIVAPTIVVPMW